MSIEEQNVVDVVSIDPRTDRIVLTISDHLDWSDQEDHLQKLQVKINRYIAFIESGEALDSFPKGVQRPCEIEVAFRFDPPNNAIHFLDSARQFLDGLGIHFSYRTFPEG